MKNKHIQFDAPERDGSVPNDGHVKGSFKKAAAGILLRIFPKTKTVREYTMGEVRLWYLECNGETGVPQREIGLTREGWPLIKMAANNTYGYWTNSNLLQDDFIERFNTSELNREYFEQKWELANKLSYFEIKISDYKAISTGEIGRAHV